MAMTGKGKTVVHWLKDEELLQGLSGTLSRWQNGVRTNLTLPRLGSRC